MRAQPPKPKKSKFIYTALLCSVLLHLGLVAAPLLSPSAPEPESLKPVNITLTEYQLEPTQKTPAPPEPPAAPTAPKNKPIKQPAIMSQPKVPVQPQKDKKTKEQTKLNQIASDEKDETDTATDKMDEQAQSTTQLAANTDTATQNTADDATNQQTQNNGDDQNESANQDDTQTDKSSKASSGPKLTEKDIANNGNLIQPKAGTKPSFPSNAQLRYEGPAGVTGYMSFQRGGGRYKLTTNFNIPFYKMSFESTGLVEGKYFKPLTYTDKRKGKIYAQAIFDYDKQEIRYGKGAEAEQVEPLTHHAQDFFTLAWQMALNGGKLSEPMQVTNGKKVYLHSNFSPKGDRQYDSNEGKINVQVFRINRGEDGIEFAFAPDFANIPAQIILTDGGKTHQLRLIGITLDGVDYWQAIRRTRDK